MAKGREEDAKRSSNLGIKHLLAREVVGVSPKVQMALLMDARQAPQLDACTGGSSAERLPHLEKFIDRIDA